VPFELQKGNLQSETGLDPSSRDSPATLEFKYGTSKAGWSGSKW
jgi:hypothetical protein